MNNIAVLYDHQVFETQEIGGISRYFSELIKANPSAVTSVKYTDNVYLTGSSFGSCNFLPKNLEYNNFLPNVSFKGKGRLAKFIITFTKKNNLGLSIDKLRHSNFDIFHPTYYHPYFLKYLKGKPFVLTVHDMIHELFAELMQKDDMTALYKKELLKKAGKIIAISKCTKNDILKLYPDIDSDKIKVIYHGSSFAADTNDHTNKKNYLLFTGSRHSYKNFKNFVFAVAPLLKKYNINLMCTGNPFTNEETSLLLSLNISDKVNCKLVSDKELAKLYSDALMFIFPSLYEGFGFPVLEAFSSGCPAVLSNTSSLPEIAGEAAVYFDPYSIENMRTVIDDLILSESLQKQLCLRGKERLKKYTREHCIDETMRLYKSVT